MAQEEEAPPKVVMTPEEEEEHLFTEFLNKMSLDDLKAADERV
jgi:hypothetical protein